MTTEEMKALGESVVALRKALDDNSQTSAAQKAKVEKIEAAMAKLDDANQKDVAERMAIKNENAELKGKIEALDKVLSSPNFGKGTQENKLAYRETAEYKALQEFCKKGIESLNVEQKAAMRTDENGAGGYLVPQVLASEILKQIEQISPVRQFARKWTMQSKSFDIPVRTGIPTAAYEGEAEEASQSKSSYRSEKLTGHRQTAVVAVTLDMLQFAGFNIESEIMTDAKLAFATTEGNKFLLGTGSKQPEGILVNATVVAGAAESASTGVVTLDDVIKLSGSMKVGYNPIYGFNRKTLVNLRTQKDSNGNYLWRIGGETQPTQINGFDYVLMQDMADIANGSKSVFFADLFQGYSIFDSVQMSVIRDIYSLKKSGMVEFTINRWNHGQVVMPEAIKLLVTKS